MNSLKKFALIPQVDVSTRQSESRNNYFEAPGSELQKILVNNKIPLSIKVKYYEDLLKRHLRSKTSTEPLITKDSFVQTSGNTNEIGVQADQPEENPFSRYPEVEIPTIPTQEHEAEINTLLHNVTTQTQTPRPQRPNTLTNSEFDDEQDRPKRKRKLTSKEIVPSRDFEPYTTIPSFSGFSNANNASQPNIDNLRVIYYDALSKISGTIDVKFGILDKSINKYYKTGSADNVFNYITNPELYNAAHGSDCIIKALAEKGLAQSIFINPRAQKKYKKYSKHQVGSGLQRKPHSSCRWIPLT